MVIIADANDFNFDEYCKKLTENSHLSLKESNGKDHATFIARGHTWPTVTIFELDTWVIEADVFIDISNIDGKIDLNYGASMSNRYERNQKIVVYGTTLPFIGIMMLLIYPISVLFSLSFLLLLLFIPWTFYQMEKYNSIAMQHQNHAVRRMLFRDTEANNMFTDHWLDHPAKS